jgi:glucokinase
MNRRILALDFGGTKLTAGATVQGVHNWLAHQIVFSPPEADKDSDLDVMVALAWKLLEGVKPDVVGVSFGGPVDYDTGVVRLSHHVPGWEGFPLREVLENEFGVPVKIDNDANAAALGEHRFGAGRDLDHLCYITVSTGVGSGWILNGIPWRGADGMAGEIGHTTVDPDGPMCLCGKRGCVERFVSGPYMAQNVREVLQKDPGEGDILRWLVKGDLELITGKILAEASNLGDQLAWKVLKKGAWALGVGIGNAANLVNPQGFFLGGGVSKAGGRFWSVIHRVARETALPEIRIKIIQPDLGDDAPLWGAVVLALEGLPG